MAVKLITKYVADIFFDAVDDTDILEAAADEMIEIAEKYEGVHCESFIGNAAAAAYVTVEGEIEAEVQKAADEVEVYIVTDPQLKLVK